MWINLWLSVSCKLSNNFMKISFQHTYLSPSLASELDRGDWNFSILKPCKNSILRINHFNTITCTLLHDYHFALIFFLPAYWTFILRYCISTKAISTIWSFMQEKSREHRLLGLGWSLFKILIRSIWTEILRKFSSAYMQRQLNRKINSNNLQLPVYKCRSQQKVF